MASPAKEKGRAARRRGTRPFPLGWTRGAGPLPHHPPIVPLGWLGGGAGWCELIEKCANRRFAWSDWDRPRSRALFAVRAGAA